MEEKIQLKLIKWNTKNHQQKLNTILQQQKKSWSKFCESISFKNTPRKIWNFFKKLSGKATTMEYPIMDNKLPLTYINHKLENF